MKKDQDLLDGIHIAAPCSVDWGSMNGDERIRFCGQCKLNVYNISEMSRSEAADLIREKEGKLCVRMYKRKDGTVITDNCPVGLRRLRDKSRALVAYASAAIAWLGLPGSVNAQNADSADTNETGKPRAGRIMIRNESVTHPQGMPAPSTPQTGVSTSDGPQALQGSYIPGPETATATAAFPGEEETLPQVLQGGAAPATCTSTACPAPVDNRPMQLVIALITLAFAGFGALFAWRKKKASLWILGGIAAVILTVAGFAWGLSGSFRL